MNENKNAVLLFNSDQQHSFSAMADCLVTLNPGKNVVSIAKLEKLCGESDSDDEDEIALCKKCASKSFIEMLEDETIKIIDESAVDVAESSVDDKTGIADLTKTDIKINIVELGSKEATTLIKSEVEVGTVQGYLTSEQESKEPRKGVIKACEEAILALEKPAPKTED